MYLSGCRFYLNDEPVEQDGFLEPALAEIGRGKVIPVMQHFLGTLEIEYLVVTVFDPVNAEIPF